VSGRPTLPPWPDLRAVLFDLDGTLYDQRRLRVLMALELLALAAASPRRAPRVWKSIASFRHAREELRALGQPTAQLETLQYTEAARRAHTDEAAMRAVVEEWIFRRPLRHLPRCRRRGLREHLRFLRERGLSVGIFSDYPGRDKLLALGVAEHVSLVVCATDAAVNAFKPHPRGLTHACGAWGLRPEQVLYVGDRPDVDAPPAAALGMPCAIVGVSFRDGRSAAPPFFGFSSFAELTRALGG
jgi:FMN phosphatase YigB (HAD superfamily)